ncbi:hypothetical protein MTP10_30405 [Nonomuraea sp. 3-1Str]|uniref:hypothetical protein n=1 Tax=Nonomuraea sp. 3-1Str TaxID=2929801 RepID=UPI00286011AA|nr:hypothetical protein [Nonomuraea sp. 3-1Str]MDR8413032.1 hypothetical protein [Nonomuraea sp. 3-1Str]
MAAWHDLHKLIIGGDVAGTVAYVAGLGPADRRTVAAELAEHVRRRPRWEGRWRHEVRPLMLAGAGCLGGSAAVASWLFRRDFRWRRQDPRDVERLLGLLRDRPEPWRADLASRLAARLRLPDLQHWELTAALVRETGVEPPDGAAFTIGWLRALTPASAAADPLLPAMAQRIFEADGLSEALPGAVPTLAALTDSGLLERRAVLDGVVGRLLRDGQNGLPLLATLHDRLAPSLGETAERAKDYARLLPAAPVAVAETAVARLRALDEAGRLTGELFAEAVESLAFRPEPRLLRSLLSWLGATAAGAATSGPGGGRADVALRVLSQVAGHDSLVLQERAVRLAVKLAPVAGEEGREAVREAAAALPADLRDRIGAAYGEVGGEAPPEVPVLVAVPAPQPLPSIASPRELVRELIGFRWPYDPLTFERLLAGLAEWSHREPDALREALRPWWEPHRAYAFDYFVRDADDALDEVLDRAFFAFAMPKVSRELPHDPERARDRWAVAAGAIDRLSRRRAFELVAPFERGVVHPVLLATPTSGTGHVDHGVLLDRLERLEAAGARALPADLTQALLRLPREIDAATVRRVRTFTSDAGRACASWMAGDRLADPEVSCRPRVSGMPGSVRWSVDVVVTGRDAALPEPVAGLFEPAPEHRHTLGWWPRGLPSHRELAAAHLVPHLAASVEVRDGGAAVLPAPARGGGPAGTATAYALACGMSHAGPAARASATDALLILAARGEVPVEAMADALTERITNGYAKLNRVAAVLGDATRAGAHEAVWALSARLVPGLLLGVLPGLIPELLPELVPGLLPADGDRPRAGLADLLAVAAAAARLTAARADLPGLAELASRKGSSRLLQEARRLQRLIAPRPDESPATS